MSYLLDTNACIRYLNSRNNPILHRLNLLSSDDVFLCDIVKFELYYGAYKSQNKDKNLASLETFFDEFVSLPFDGQAADICGRIRSELNKKGTPKSQQPTLAPFFASQRRVSAEIYGDRS